MLQKILDKYINPEVSNSTTVHTNTQMRNCIIETFNWVVEDNIQAVDKADIDPRVLPIIQDYYEQQINK